MAASKTTTGTSTRIGGLSNDTLYYFAVTAINKSGGETKEVSVLTASPVGDIFGPNISSLTYNNSNVANAYVVTANGRIGVSLSDPSGIGRVEFQIDNGTKITDASSSGGYNISLDISKFADGAHTLTVDAYDTKDNPTTVTYDFSIATPLPTTVPTITSPSEGQKFNQENIIVSGTAPANSSVRIYRDTALLADNITTNSNGNFNAGVKLIEGNNALQAVIYNRTGEGDRSTARNVELDTNVPKAPEDLSVSSLEDGEIKISWVNKETESTIAGYRIYRSNASFTDKASATQIVDENNLKGTSYKDLPESDGLYFYRVSAVSDTGIESPLSNIISANSDGTAPTILSVEYNAIDNFDESTSTFGRGIVDVIVTTSEELTASPYFALTTPGGVPITVTLTKDGPKKYKGSFKFISSSGTGVATAIAFDERLS